MISSRLRASIGVGLAIVLFASLSLASARAVPWYVFWLAALLCFGGTVMLTKTAQQTP